MTCIWELHRRCSSPGSCRRCLPLHGGRQLAIDTTLVSTLKSNGEARRWTADFDGAALEVARRQKERTYPELVGPHSRAKLVVLAGEVAGRWSTETLTFLSKLAKAKSRDQPRLLRRRAEQAWRMRWCAVLRRFSPRSEARGF